MLSSKKGISDLVQICAQQGIEHAILSPGSRNAPLTVSLDAHPDITCLSVPDERVAAFVALGMAQQSRKPVIICCTSGSAALNYPPAIAEAYYQKIPLLILTADRPNEWTDQGDGQTIRQRDIFSNYIKASYELPQEPADADALWHNRRLISEAINVATFPLGGPVHVNIPLREPLYDRSSAAIETKPIIETAQVESSLPQAEIERLASIWNTTEKKLILTGVLQPNPALNNILSQLAEDASVAVLTEQTSNLSDPKFNPCIDRTLAPIAAEEEAQYNPDLLITFGGQIISKKIKAFIRRQAPKAHWHIDLTDFNLDTFQRLSLNIPVQPLAFFEALAPHVVPRKSDYQQLWKTLDLATEKASQEYFDRMPYADLAVFKTLLEHIPADSHLQMGNSTPVRYVQLFKALKPLQYFANRGTSGIDGSTSTAVGAAIQSKALTTVVSGDVSFFYDSNALWNQHLPGNLRVVVINNAGGGIFRIIEGPSSTDQLETYFQTKHNYSAEHIAKAFHVPYYKATSLETLEAVLPQFYAPQNNDRPAVLEVYTPDEINDQVLKDFFKALK